MALGGTFYCDALRDQDPPAGLIAGTMFFRDNKTRWLERRSVNGNIRLRLQEQPKKNKKERRSKLAGGGGGRGSCEERKDINTRE
jgi:hypothetical protein